MTSSFKQIAVLIDPGTAWGRGIIRGVIQYAHQTNNWQFVAETESPPVGRTLPSKWRGDGVIGNFNSPTLYQTLRKLDVPMVNVAVTHKAPQASMPCVVTDYHHAGRIAADHLLDSGFNHFAFNGGQSMSTSNLYKGYVARLQKAGHDVIAYHQAKHVRLFCDKRLEKWLTSLPRPVGVLAINDVVGRLIIQAALRQDMRVPEEIAVLGVTNDEVLCEMCHPPLSSVALSTERQGFLAARMLDQLMAGESPPTAPILVEALGVVARQSTDILLVDNTDVAQAIAFIRRHATDPIDVKDVMAEVPVSRRSLEGHFKRYLGRGIAAEIRRCQVNKAKELLAITDMQMPAIAAAVGFRTGQYLARAFRRAVGITPQAYRMKHRCR